MDRRKAVGVVGFLISVIVPGLIGIASNLGSWKDQALADRFLSAALVSSVAGVAIGVWSIWPSITQRSQALGTRVRRVWDKLPHYRIERTNPPTKPQAAAVQSGAETVVTVCEPILSVWWSGQESEVREPARVLLKVAIYRAVNGRADELEHHAFYLISGDIDGRAKVRRVRAFTVPNRVKPTDSVQSIEVRKEMVVEPSSERSGALVVLNQADTGEFFVNVCVARISGSAVHFYGYEGAGHRPPWESESGQAVLSRTQTLVQGSRGRIQLVRTEAVFRSGQAKTGEMKLMAVFNKKPPDERRG